MSVHAEIMPAYLVGNFKLTPLNSFEVTNGSINLWVHGKHRVSHSIPKRYSTQK